MEPKAPLAHCDECPLKDRPFVPGYGSSEEGIVIVGRDLDRFERQTAVPMMIRALAIIPVVASHSMTPLTARDTLTRGAGDDSARRNPRNP
jgi:hypothetical protein